MELIAGYLNKTIDNIRFRVIPAGSFPLNLKIGEPDEFDFVLEYEVQCLPKKLENMVVRPILHTFYTHIRDILDNCDILAIEKNHAVNVIIFWSCHCEQEHAVHIDLAFSTKTEITVEDYLKDLGLPLRGTLFENCLDRNQNVYMNLGSSDSTHRIDTNLFDKCFFSLCDKLSPNIKMTYRILKYIRDLLFPKHRKYLRQHEKTIESDYFSSFFLKQFLLTEVINFSSSSSWREDKIHLRLSSIFSNIQKMLQEPSYSTKFHAVLVDIFGEEFTVVTNRQMDSVTNLILTDIILWLKQGCKKVIHSFTPATEGFEVVNINNMIVKMKNASFHLGEYDDRKVYVFKSVKGLASTNLSRWIFREFYEVINNLVQLDLRFCDKSDRDITLLLILDKIINKNDVESKQYLRKIATFKEILQFCNIKLEDAYNIFVDKYLHLCRKKVFAGKGYSRNDSLGSTCFFIKECRSIISARTLTEAVTIYNYFKSLQTAFREVKHTFNSKHCLEKKSDLERSLAEKMIELYQSLDRFNQLIAGDIIALIIFDKIRTM